MTNISNFQSADSINAPDGSDPQRLLALIQHRYLKLKQIIKQKEKSLENPVSGTLRISNESRRTQYYHRTVTGKNGKYIPRKELSFAIALAQKEYDEKVLRAAGYEASWLEKMLSDHPKVFAETIYDSLSPKRRELITPIELPDAEYVQQWNALAYAPKAFRDDAPEFLTAKGERVRSKSEILIADLLNRLDIPYHYECPLRLDRMNVIYPDFTVLNVRLRKTIYLEHLGMMDDAGYASGAVERIYSYIRNGVYPGDQLVLTFETMRQPLNVRLLENIFLHYFK